MKKNLLYILIIALLSTSLTSCNSKKKKYEYLSAQIVGTFAFLQVFDNSLSLERFTDYMDSEYNRIGIQKTEDGNGLQAYYRYRADNKDCRLSKDERFRCAVQYDFKRVPNELSMSYVMMIYDSSSSEDVDQFYSVVMSEFKPMLEEYEAESDTTASMIQHLYHDSDDNTVYIKKLDDSVTVMKSIK